MIPYKYITIRKLQNPKIERTVLSVPIELGDELVEVGLKCLECILVALLGQGLRGKGGTFLGIP